MADGPPSQLNIAALNTATPNLSAQADIAQSMDMHGRWTPIQLSIHALNTATPNKFHI